MITESRLEKALTFIAHSDEEHAALKARMLKFEHAAKKTKAAVFMASVGTVAEREASSIDSEIYDNAMNEYFDAVRDFNALNNKRDLEFVVIECFRTLEASRRQGNI